MIAARRNNHADVDTAAARPSEFATASPVIEREQVRGYLLCVFRSDAPLQRLRALLLVSSQKLKP